MAGDIHLGTVGAFISEWWATSSRNHHRPHYDEDGAVTAECPIVTPMTEDQTAIVTGANPGIGAATAVALKSKRRPRSRRELRLSGFRLPTRSQPSWHVVRSIHTHLARRGCAVLCNYLRIEDAFDSGIPQAYRDHRAASADDVVAQIRSAGGRAIAVEADLSDPRTPAALFDAPEQQLGPVNILVNNATGWLTDTFRPTDGERLGRTLQPVGAATWKQQFAVDAMGPTLLITEFARRHIARGATWGRIIGLTSGGDLGFPGGVAWGR
jgi:NAD(P)-dependent dehydrogenase (short-subunit alcohol dehydrogenase family)